METKQALYNDSVSLWEAARLSYLSYPNGGPRLTLHLGMVSNGYEVLARFADDRSASTVLRKAGFKRQAGGSWKAAQP